VTGKDIWGLRPGSRHAALFQPKGKESADVKRIAFPEEDGNKMPYIPGAQDAVIEPHEWHQSAMMRPFFGINLSQKK